MGGLSTYLHPPVGQKRAAGLAVENPYFVGDGGRWRGGCVRVVGEEVDLVREMVVVRRKHG